MIEIIAIVASAAVAWSLVCVLLVYIGFRMGRLSRGLETPPLFEGEVQQEKNPVEEDPYRDAMRAPINVKQTMRGE